MAVFVTYGNELQGQFNAPEGSRMLWKSVDVSLRAYSFLVEGMGLQDGRIEPVAHLVDDVPTLQMMQSAETANLVNVSKIHLITPPSKNHHGKYSMEVLAEIRVVAGTEEKPVYEFLTEGGHLYTSAHA
ncbi:hypothetical protein PZ739_10235 [Pseudomonas kermanshahensis]|uniref:hypothetical protein n=1 Tax=Pseudomonas kermanshahensis TaxID=2745482 RepID=UPI0023DC4970|nr:hypothetical protein [Pseudomonas kermanshahensis]WEL57506.1 hypothetical protein PZ739_10235 [Pseudomonas kermanshahensis]